VHEVPSGAHTSQVQLPPAHVSPVETSAQVRPVQQLDPLVQLPLTAAQLWQVPPLQTRPRQQSASPLQPCVAALQLSQMQPSPVPLQSEPLPAMQERAGLWVQQSAFVEQDWSCGWHVCGTPHLPERHCSPPATLQQSPSATQLPPVGAQTLADRHVPLVEPGGMLQARPVQQSLLAVQEPSAPVHGGAQVPPWQLLEQQSLATVHPWPFGAQDTGTLQLKVPAPKVQTVPAQQLPSSDPAQGAFSAVHADTVQRSTPAPSGTHGAELQHWSRNWQTSPAGMQQAGFPAS
jgi:hypothetical protein